MGEYAGKIDKNGEGICEGMSVRYMDFPMIFRVHYNRGLKKFVIRPNNFPTHKSYFLSECRSEELEIIKG